MFPLAGAPWLRAAETRQVLAILTADDRPARFVGGCVRDGLLDPRADVADLDLATVLPPEAVLARFKAAGLRVIPTGLAHGTVTVLAGQRRFEITTLRHDVETDGRHAVVAFTDDFVADAARRDFTINAMSVDGDGQLFDPFDGARDLAAGTVRFVGDPVRRIAEDHLRILRFFRFHARFGRGRPDAAALAACAAAAPLLDQLSGERVRMELLRLLETGHPGRSLRPMRRLGIVAHVLPGIALAVTRLERLIATDPGADSILRLAALVRDADAPTLASLAARLRLSNRDADRLLDLVTGPLRRLDGGVSAARRAVFELGVERVEDRLRLSRASRTMPPEDAARALAAIAGWTPPVFPLDGDDLLATGMTPGPALGRALAMLREWWRDADGLPDRAQCLAELNRRAAGAASVPPPDA